MSEEQQPTWKHHWHRHKSKVIGYSILAIILTLFILLIYKVAQTTPSAPYTQYPIHWHAYPQVFICGEEKTLPYPSNPAEHLGNPLLHTHAPPENYAHVEGQVFNKADITLGKYFDAIGFKFSSTQILDKTNGDLCNGKPASIKMWVNEQLNTELRDHVLADQERILIKFE